MKKMNLVEKIKEKYNAIIGRCVKVEDLYRGNKDSKNYCNSPKFVDNAKKASETFLEIADYLNESGIIVDKVSQTRYFSDCFTSFHNYPAGMIETLGTTIEDADKIMNNESLKKYNFGIYSGGDYTGDDQMHFGDKNMHCSSDYFVERYKNKYGKNASEVDYLVLHGKDEETDGLIEIFLGRHKPLKELFGHEKPIVKLR